MAEIVELTKINFPSLFISVFIMLIGIKAVVSVFEWVIEKLGIETKWMRARREEHDLLIQTSQNIAALQEKHISDIEYSDARDNEISEDVKKLTAMFVEKEIDDLRWKILDFSSAVSNGRKYNRESFDHIIKLYNKYERVLEENDMENGLVDESMKFVMKKYREHLDKGTMETSNEFYSDFDKIKID